MRRARYLAGADTSLEVESARECRCCPAIPTSTCAPARHAGLSTNYCMDHQVSSSSAIKSVLVSSTVVANWRKMANVRCSRVRVIAQMIWCHSVFLIDPTREKFMTKKQGDKRPITTGEIKARPARRADMAEAVGEVEPSHEIACWRFF